MFDLFSNNQISNLLPYDGNAIYHGVIMPIEKLIAIIMNCTITLTGAMMIWYFLANILSRIEK